VLRAGGTPGKEVRRLLDGFHDQELLDRYWAGRGDAS
jgi:hypothetical protein